RPRSGRRLPATAAPAEIVAVQEDDFSCTTAYNRPAYTSKDKLQFWHYLDDQKVSRGGAVDEDYSNQHMSGGNLVFADGHAKWRRYTAIRSSGFGLLPDVADNG